MSSVSQRSDQRRQRRINKAVGLPKDATKAVARSITNDDGTVTDGLRQNMQRIIGWQRPAVLAYVRRLAKKHQGASPDVLVKILERDYVRAVTGMGAAGGATAIVPGVGTVASLGLSAGVAVGYLEATALYTQAVAELHGVAIEDPDRAGDLVMGVMLGEEGVKILQDMAGMVAAGGRVGWNAFFSTAVGRGSTYASLVKQLHTRFLRRFAARQTATAAGRSLPFGMGAAVGGVANRVLARRVVASAERAFADLPAQLPSSVANP